MVSQARYGTLDPKNSEVFRNALGFKGGDSVHVVQPVVSPVIVGNRSLDPVPVALPGTTRSQRLFWLNLRDVGGGGGIDTDATINNVSAGCPILVNPYTVPVGHRIVLVYFKQNYTAVDFALYDGAKADANLVFLSKEQIAVSPPIGLIFEAGSTIRFNHTVGIAGIGSELVIGYDDESV